MANPCRSGGHPAWIERAGELGERGRLRSRGRAAAWRRQKPGHASPREPPDQATARSARNRGEGRRSPEQAEELAAAAAVDAPTPAQFVEAISGFAHRPEKLQRIEERLERMAAVAEQTQVAVWGRAGRGAAAAQGGGRGEGGGHGRVCGAENSGGQCGGPDVQREHPVHNRRESLYR